MEIRTTLEAGESFVTMLRQLQQNGQKASMLVDSDGLLRAEGQIVEVVTDAKRPYFTLNDGTKIEIASIAALNGVFLPEYSQC